MSSKIFSVVRSFFSKKLPYIIFFITARCNSKCRMCFYWKNIENMKKDELTLEEIKKISVNFNRIEYLSIGGGEPTLREDMAEIVKTFVKNNKVKFVSVPTNALLPERAAKLAEDIFKNCPNTSFRIALSIDGIGKDHDYIRGVKGNFEKVGETYGLLNELRKKYSNFNIDATTVFSRYNQNNIREIFEWVEKNMKIDNHVLLLTRGDTKESVAKNIDFEKYKAAVDYVDKKTKEKEARRKDFSLKLLRALKLVMRDIIVESYEKKKMIVPCLAGKKMAIVSEGGDVYPCEILGMKMGDLRESGYDISKILKSENAKKVIRFIKKTKCYCTFECALQNSLVYNPKEYPRIFAKLLKMR